MKKQVKQVQVQTASLRLSMAAKSQLEFFHLNSELSDREPPVSPRQIMGCGWGHGQRGQYAANTMSFQSSGSHLLRTWERRGKNQDIRRKGRERNPSHIQSLGTAQSSAEQYKIGVPAFRSLSSHRKQAAAANNAQNLDEYKGCKKPEQG